ncbi:FecR family protein [uncultured Alistipes sp.]|jgi:hypothetical protein|uniref:FecR family protein n=1 Tax=uncultured Alistipes sp. TaxID=538949 RepID=UPI0025CC7291|nr:FecR family protein [uncultured Alistipes sp.]
MDKELLYRFFNGEASIREEKRVLDWLDADPSNRAQMLAERRLFDAMLMHGELRSASRIRRIVTLPKWAREVAKYAAVILVMAGLGGAYVSRMNDRLLLSANTISVPAGQRVDVVLPDGTKVCMNALSELRYPTFFVGKQRKVQLRGEAFFDVKHDAKQPFIVETFACEVEVLGTKFDVEARPEANEFVTSLVEGRVRVTDRSNPANSIELRPNEQLNRRNGRFVISQIPEHEQFLWREGLIAFRDASFMELISDFEKYFGVTIEVPQDRVFPQNLFTGKIRIAEGVDHALWVLQRSVDFNYARNENKDIIYIQ